MSDDLPEVDDPRFHAAVALIGRTGASSFMIRYDDDPSPIVWVALALYKGRVPASVVDQHVNCEYEGESYVGIPGAGMTAMDAVLRLCDDLIDGGRCAHCRRPTAFSSDFTEMPAEETICWTKWDPELTVFRRQCEGSTR